MLFIWINSGQQEVDCQLVFVLTFADRASTGAGISVCSEL